MVPCSLGGLQWACNVNTNVHTQVQFCEPVSTVEHPKINEWLSLVEGQMRFTLASSLAQAVQDIKQFKDGAIDRQAYMHWCDKYQVMLLHRILAA
jgi:dynein heavy chain 1